MQLLAAASAAWMPGQVAGDRDVHMTFEIHPGTLTATELLARLYDGWDEEVSEGILASLV